MRIVLVGGGTGGHFYPLIAVAESLNAQEKRPELYYLGPEEYDAEALKQQNIKYVYCTAGKVRRYGSIRNFLDFFKNIFGVISATLKLFAIYPDVVFSKGGYASVPMVLAARILFIPVVIHESDSVPGRANKLAAKFARYIAIAHEDVAQFFPEEKTALVGIPIRTEVAMRYDKAEARAALGIPNDRALIFITGGSSGAERLNNQVVDALPKLLRSVRVFHQVGSAGSIFTKERIKNKQIGEDQLQFYYLKENLDGKTMSLIFSAADLIVSRAGSSTLFEIAIHETPSILVPIPESISHDQRTNAYSYARNGAAHVIEEHNLSNDILVQEINGILTDQQRYAEMVAATHRMQYPDAANKIADILLSIGKEHGSY